MSIKHQKAEYFTFADKTLINLTLSNVLSINGHADDAAIIHPRINESFNSSTGSWAQPWTQNDLVEERKTNQHSFYVNGAFAMCFFLSPSLIYVKTNSILRALHGWIIIFYEYISAAILRWHILSVFFDSDDDGLA